MTNDRLYKLVIVGGMALITSFVYFLVSFEIIHSFIIFTVVYIVLFFGHSMDKGTKTDKGFEFSYWRLSNRRKFIRNVCLFPLIVGVIMLLWFVSPIESWRKVTVTLFLFVAYAMQLFYTWIKWKKSVNL